jgi:hypothetical protein
MRRALVILCALAVSVALAACGDDDDAGGGTTPGTTTARAVDAGELLQSVKDPTTGPKRVDTTVTTTLRGRPQDQTLAAFVGQPLSLRAAGRGEPTSRKADLSLAVDAGLVNVEGRYLSEGTRNYAELLGAWYTLPATPQGVSPVSWLEVFGRPADFMRDGATIVGEESVEGIEADVVEGEGDRAEVARGLSRVSSSLTFLTGTTISPATIEKALRDVRVRLWIGQEDRQVHRVRLDAKLDLAGTDLGARGLSGADLLLDGWIVDTDEAVTVTPPANPRPLSELEGALGGLSIPGLFGG